MTGRGHSKRRRTGGALVAALVLLCVPTLAQEPAPVTWGSYMAADGRATPIEWKLTNARASQTAAALRLEVEPKGRGSVESVPLSLAPLRLYTISMTCRRGPGLGLDVRVRWLDAEGKAGARLMVWQLPERPRPNYWPLSALRNTYAQRFCLPPEATQVTVQINLTGHPDAGYDYFEIYDLALRRGAEVPFGERLGPNLVAAGGMETVDAAGMAVGWGFWGTPVEAKVLEQDEQGRGAHGGRRFLVIPPGQRCILAGGVFPVERGRAYRLSFWARGQGDVGFGAQSLETITGLRVDDAQATNVRLESQDWQEFSSLWFAAGLHTDNANPFMSINPQTELHLDDVALQLIEP